MIFLFEIGFLPVTFWDILDILIVGYLIYIIYKTLKGSIAFNIFIGVATLLLVYWLLRLLQMEMVSSLLNQVASLGVIGIIVIFQPEIRRFLLLLGNRTLKSRSNIIGRWLIKNLNLTDPNTTDFEHLKTALLQMSKEKTGALIVLAKNLDREIISDTGTNLDALISHALLLSIFNKYSPLHDGAVIIGQGRIVAAGCVLPLSESISLPTTAGLRHRAALGIAEKTNVSAFVVSEETGSISFSNDGQMEFSISKKRLEELLHEQIDAE